MKVKIKDILFDVDVIIPYWEYTFPKIQLEIIGLKEHPKKISLTPYCFVSNKMVIVKEGDAVLTTDDFINFIKQNCYNLF